MVKADNVGDQIICVILNIKLFVMKKIIIIFLTMVLEGLSFGTHAQIVASVSPTAAVNTLLGTGVTVSNVTFTGSASEQLCQFTNGLGEIGIDQGIALTTGHYNFITTTNTSNVG